MKVSIITIVYNNKSTITDCIESVQNQTYGDIEHIVIDGGSTDGTKELIEKHRDKLAVFISEKDNGLYDALNKGIKHATGDIIGILHSDDIYYDKYSIALVVNRFKISGADLLYGNGLYISKESEKTKRIYDSKPFDKKYLKYGWIPLHTTIYVKREVFDKHGFYSLKYSIASDYDISLRWFTDDSLKKEYINQYLVKMRLGGKSTSGHLQQKKSTEDLEIIKNHKLNGIVTLGFKIARKIPQYISPLLIKHK